jgi:hypothetical protein
MPLAASLAKASSSFLFICICLSLTLNRVIYDTQLHKICYSLEGCERSSLKERVRFLDIAKSSLGEFKTQADIGVVVGFINKEPGLYFLDEASQISKMLGSLISKLKSQLES